MANSSGATHSKIVAMLGLGAVVFVGVTWLLPKFERHHGHHISMLPHMASHPAHMGAMKIQETVATGPVARAQSIVGNRDYNLAGLAMEKVHGMDIGIDGIA